MPRHENCKEKQHTHTHTHIPSQGLQHCMSRCHWQNINLCPLFPVSFASVILLTSVLSDKQLLSSCCNDWISSLRRFTCYQGENRQASLAKASLSKSQSSTRWLIVMGKFFIQPRCRDVCRCKWHLFIQTEPRHKSKNNFRQMQIFSFYSLWNDLLLAK